MRGRSGDANLRRSDHHPVSLLAAERTRPPPQRPSGLGHRRPRLRRRSPGARLRHLPARLQLAQLQAALGRTNRASLDPGLPLARAASRARRRQPADPRRRRSLAAAAPGVGGRSRPARLRQGPGMSEAVVVPPRPRWLVRVAAWLIAAAVLFVAARRVDFAALAAALQGAAWGWVARALFCSLVANPLARVRRWQALLEPIPHQKRASFM